MRKLLVVFLSVFLLFGAQFPVHAQDQAAARLSLYSLETGAFPTITAGLDVFDSAGNVISGLKADALTLLEDDQPRPLKTLEEVQVGVEFALALDPGPTFAYRDANAVSRYDKVVLALNEWVATHTDTLGDDLSLVPNYGTLSTHLGTTAAFSEALAAYQPNLQVVTPSLSTLSHALDAVSETTPQPGMKRSVLFVTSPTSVEDLPTLQSLTERAAAQQVRVHVWIVASTDFFLAPGATALTDLAIRTGGQVVKFSGVEPLPGLEMYLAPLRTTYRLAYESGVLASGEHTLAAQASLDSGTVASVPLPFKLDIQPPNPILLDPPVQIVRQAPDMRSTSATAFFPSKQLIEIIVEFPDGRTRPLVRTVLYVDGLKIAENTAEPFDKFTWDLSDYSTSGQHILNVEAVDSLGLSKASLGVPVTVTIIKPQIGLIPFLSRNSLWVTLIAVLFAGAVLAAILGGGRIRRRSHRAERAAALDPLTQPVKGVGGRHIPHVSWKHSTKQSDAYLVRLKEDGQSLTATPIQVSSPEMTFGSDPMQVTRIMDDPSVSPLHARLRVENGEYILSDEKSTAGTWVNYVQLTAPQRLQHGDILNIGRLSYRFMLRHPPERQAPKITPTKA
jgi:hypothetical protein